MQNRGFNRERRRPPASLRHYHKSSVLAEGRLCERIRSLAAERGMSRAELANKAGISYRQVHSIMHGGVRIRDATIGKIAKAFALSVDDLLQSSPQAAMRDGPLVWNAREPEVKRLPETVHAAVQLLADQFGLPPRAVLEALMNLMADKHDQKE